MLEVYTYNAGKGDCIRLHFAGTHNIFIDSGVSRFAPAFRRTCNQIKQSGETLDVLVLTHVDDDHIGGILSCLRSRTYQCSFSEVWMNHSGNASIGDRTLSIQQNDEVFARLRDQGIRVVSTHAGDQRIIAGALIEIFWPEANVSDAGGQHQQYKEVQLARHSDYHLRLSELADMTLPTHDTSPNNRRSIVLSFAYDNHRLLFTGDAWAEDVVRAKGSYDLIKLPHHGSARNISEVYKENIQSSDFLICTDGVNHPDKQTIAKLEKWYGEINIYSPSAWWGNGFFSGDDRRHKIKYYQKEGLVVTW